VNTAHNVVSLVVLTRTLPDLDPECIRLLYPLHQVANTGCTPLLLALLIGTSSSHWRLLLWQTPFALLWELLTMLSERSPLFRCFCKGPHQLFHPIWPSPLPYLWCLHQSWHTLLSALLALGLLGLHMHLTCS
jgi:hypothetical protein